MSQTGWLSYCGPASSGGTVYGTALNFRAALAALGDAVQAPPYGAPPRAPILYIKPRNTWIGDGEAIPMPPGQSEIAVGPTFGIVIGRSARWVPVAGALEYVAGYAIVNDLALPHTSYFRPALQQQCRDGFCVLGPRIVPPAAVPDTSALAMRVHIDGTLRLSCSSAELIRPVARLLSDVSEFMTLHAGDLLLVGLPADLPRVRAGQRVSIEIDGLGRLDNPVVADSGAAAPAPTSAPARAGAP